VADHVEYVVNGAGDEAAFTTPPKAKGKIIGNFANDIQLLLAGPPCQGHSALNNHTRHDDPRNGLYLSVPAIAIALGIPNVVIENVPGVVSTAAKLLKRADYQVEMGVLAADELGWPQTRKRFFLVASRWGAPRPLSQIREEFASDARPISWALNKIPSKKVDPRWMSESAQMSEENLERMRWLIQNDEYDLPNHMRPKCHQQGTTYNANYGRMRWDRPAGTSARAPNLDKQGGSAHPGHPRLV
jgi:DNA (cytosine-5)-methyltransferase 1